MSTGVPASDEMRLDSAATSDIAAPEGLRAVVRTSFDAPGLRDAWEHLSATGEDASLFTTYDWCRCWAGTVGQAAQPLILQFIDDEDRTIGIMPLCRVHERTGGWLKFMGRDRASGDHLDLLSAAADRPACLGAMFGWLDDHADDYEGLVLGELTPGGVTHQGAIAWARKRHHAWLEREPRRVAYIDLPARFEDYVAGLSKNMRHHVRRRLRGVDEHGDARVELISEPDQVDVLMRVFFDLHARRWAADGLPGNYTDDQMQAFLSGFCRIMAEREQLRAHVLYVGSAAHAVLIGFRWRDLACSYQIGREPESPVASPGSVVYARHIEQAIRDGATRYDMLRTHDNYKLSWAKEAVEQVTLVIACGLSAKMTMRMERVKEHAKKLVQDRLGGEAWSRTKRLLGRG